MNKDTHPVQRECSTTLASSTADGELEDMAWVLALTVNTGCPDTFTAGLDYKKRKQKIPRADKGQTGLGTPRCAPVPKFPWSFPGQ